MKNQTTYEKLLIEYAKKIKQLQGEVKQLKLDVDYLNSYNAVCKQIDKINDKKPDTKPKKKYWLW